MVCLDELVPADDRYRRLDELVDWSFVRESAAPYYADEGRPSLDPIVLVKLALCGALEGIGSVRELLRVAAMRLDLRRFLGYGFKIAPGPPDDLPRPHPPLRRRPVSSSACSPARWRSAESMT
ncbi:MAG TPA: transposase [Thermoleophilaceae bacterium]|nr:transposase [Thermoleophilaceae bacterium]